MDWLAYGFTICKEHRESAQETIEVPMAQTQEVLTQDGAMLLFYRMHTLRRSLVLTAHL
jgi:hypothetical protein